MMPKLVIVNWDDAVSPEATAVVNMAEVASVHQSLPIQTVGWVLADDEKGITVAAEYCADGDYRSVTHIPRQLITATRVLSVKKPPKPKAEPKTGEN